ncbi:hypothetical protein BH11MYX1_BH11MYX1_14620 [soil metagenome]
MSTATKLARIVALAALALLVATSGHAGVLHDLAAEVGARLDALRAARAVKTVVPVKIAVTWRPQRLTPVFELGAPLMALGAADLDGDGRAELYAVTAREVIAFSIADHHVKELARVSFVGDQAMPAPRDPIGAVFIEGKALVASSSAFRRTLRVSWQHEHLVGVAGEPGIEQCPGEHVQLAFGRNFVGDDKTGSYVTRCREIIDAHGDRAPVRGVLGLTGKLEVVRECPIGIACERPPVLAFAKVGTAFELADLDRDGTAELIYASANAPGDADDIRVVSLGGDEKKPTWKKAFTAGGVAGIAVGEFDGPPAVIAAVRLVGATRVDLWRLN